MDDKFKHIKDLWDEGDSFYKNQYASNRHLKPTDLHTVFIEILSIEPLEGTLQEIETTLSDYKDIAKDYEVHHNCAFDQVVFISAEFKDYSYMSGGYEWETKWSLVGKRKETKPEYDQRITFLQETSADEKTKLKALGKKNKAEELKEYKRLKKKLNL